MKHTGSHWITPTMESPPVRGRGLKLVKHRRPIIRDGVAPRAGARIETMNDCNGGNAKASPPARGRGLKPP